MVWNKQAQPPPNVSLFCGLLFGLWRQWGQTTHHESSMELERQDDAEWWQCWQQKHQMSVSVQPETWNKAFRESLGPHYRINLMHICVNHTIPSKSLLLFSLSSMCIATKRITSWDWCKADGWVVLMSVVTIKFTGFIAAANPVRLCEKI